MPHPYPIREIARQAGLSEATVDRVLNARGGVRASTVQEVHRAIADLDRQRSQVRLTGRTFLLDLVVDAPARFSSAVRAALESQLPLVRPATFRARFHLAEAPPVTGLAATLDGIARRGSQGVVLKAPDHPLVVAAVERLAEAGIPVVTLVTDLPTSRRVAYVGLDNRAAGATAAYLLDQWLPDDAAVLVTRGTGSFRGEDDREMGFRATARALRPGGRQVDLVDVTGDDDVLRGLVRDALAADPGIAAVYSMYAAGGNAATVAAFADAGRGCRAFVAHDLDAENLALLREGRLSAVLHHDLALDLRRACHVVMQAHGALPGTPRSWHSGVQVVTPHNIPAELLSAR
ncbi:LacI family DNA-binding transcriptional regulator [Geodermatophilus sp. DSM 45219]|uniref:LacI family DNA-binding transcriptional regulator n=1 Tax=Geodermatophilus sp. DSM 45219 TaxID=1881103 RepID=UPI00088C4DE2|nr:LacI family DNA-binding transcriptional regulator [Geodermatophilus sp. DSM 45219]SDN97113.1 transcriptional regulator, LacI family [Geodermatophilus sp. DSM 45219]